LKRNRTPSAKQDQPPFKGDNAATNFLRAGAEWKALVAHWIDCRHRHPRVRSKMRIAFDVGTISVVLGWISTHLGELKAIAATILQGH